jgi:Bacterial PH domain
VNVSEHEHEALRGLPAALPPGERLLWQGAPDWRVLAVEALHVRKFALYFAALIAWRAADTLATGAGALDALWAAAFVMPLALAALGLLAGFAWLVGRTTVYSVTDRRVVMRIGVVLSVTFNLPFSAIGAASLRLRADGHGDIALALAGSDRIAWLHLWPHARAWRLRRPEPMLRALPQARQVAQTISDALARSSAQAGTTLPAAPQRPLPGTAGRARPMATA